MQSSSGFNDSQLLLGSINGDVPSRLPLKLNQPASDHETVSGLEGMVCLSNGCR